MEHSEESAVWIVLLNWNGIDDTLDCLRSLQEVNYRNFHVLVVDNGSGDDSVGRLQRYEARFPFELIETRRNLGFAEGNNVGIRRALAQGAEYVLLLNNDTVVDPNFLGAFVCAAQARPDGAVFSGRIYYFDCPSTLWYAGATWRCEGQYFQHDGIGQVDDGAAYQQIVETDYASGCAFFMRASALQTIGLLDAKYFLTYEESDLCYRARKAGFRVLFVPEAKLWHKVSASFGGVDSPLQLYFYSRNVLLWAERHLPRREYWSLFRKTAADALRFGGNTETSASAVQRAYWSLGSMLQRLRRSGSDPAGRARYLGLRDYLLRRFGDCPAEVRQLRSGA
jgi:hypothetical protein